MDNIERYILDSHILVVKRDFEADDPVPMHWHEYYEIEIFLSGKGKMFLNGEEYSFEKGSLFFLTPVDFHRIDFHEKTEALNISFDPACLEDTLMPEILMTMGSMAKLDDLENLLVMINRLKNEIENQKSFSKKYVSSVMNCILIDIYRKCGAGTKEISRIKVADEEIFKDLENGYYSKVEYANQMYLSGDKLIVIKNTGEWSETKNGNSYEYTNDEKSSAQIYDVSDPAAPKFLTEAGQNGSTG